MTNFSEMALNTMLGTFHISYSLVTRVSVIPERKIFVAAENIWSDTRLSERKKPPA
jgi:hypothetical protein